MSKLFAVASMDIPSDSEPEMDVVEVCSTPEKAAVKCADYIVERLYLRPDIRYAFMHNTMDDQMLETVAYETAPDKESVIEWRDEIERHFAYDLKKEEWTPPERVVESVRKYLAETILRQRSYDIQTEVDSDIGFERYVFQVFEVGPDFSDKETE